MLIPKWDVTIKQQSSRIWVLCGKEAEKLYESEVVDNLKEAVSSRQNRTDVHMNSQTR
jgi:predicted oxidoreductase (fatty acid repression mutant protein)